MYNSDGSQAQGPYGYDTQYGYHQTQRQQMQVQIAGFVPVPSEMDARRYPMSPWTMMVFYNTNAPYCYTKTRRDRSEPPEFHIFRDVDFYPAQPMPQQPVQQQQTAAPQPQQQIDVRAEMAALEDRITARLTEALSAATNKPAKGGKQNENA